MARVLTFGAALVFLWKFFWMVYPAIFIGLIAVLIAIILHAPAPLLSRWLSHRASVAVSTVLFLAAVGALLTQLIPQVLSQVTVLAGQLPAAMAYVESWIQQRTGGRMDPQFAREFNAQLAEFIGRFVPIAFNLVAVFTGSFAILFLAIFLAAQPDTYRDLLLQAVPPQSRERGRQIYDEVGRTLKQWVLSKLFSMLMTGVCVWIALELFEVPGALALASLAALMEFIPTFGPTIAAVPAVIAALLVSPMTALWVAVFYFGFQQLQAAIVIPMIERRAVNIPPAALLVWQLMLAVGFGILGLFVATPLLAVISVVARRLYFEPLEKRREKDRRGGEVVRREE